MASFTTFFKLLKPEKNDYVDVEKHISENYDKIDSKIQELSVSNGEKLEKGSVTQEYNSAYKIENKIKSLISSIETNSNSIDELMKLINDNSNFRGIIKNQADLNNANKTGWYKVSDFQINNMYGYGFLYVIVHEQTTLQIFFSHKSGIAYRQDWSRNITPVPWTKIGEGGGNVDVNKILGIEFAGDLNNGSQKIKGKAYYDTANRKIFRCLENTNVNNADSRYFMPISNNDLFMELKDCRRSLLLHFQSSYSSQEQFEMNKVKRIPYRNIFYQYLLITINTNKQYTNIGQTITFIEDFRYCNVENTRFFGTNNNTKVEFEIDDIHCNFRFSGENAENCWVQRIELMDNVYATGEVR